MKQRVDTSALANDLGSSSFFKSPTPTQNQQSTDTPVLSKIVSKSTELRTVERTANRTSTPTNEKPSLQTVEELSFRVRKEPMVRVSADIPEKWKKQLDLEAVKLGIKKYDLLKYIVAQYLGEVGE